MTWLVVYSKPREEERAARHLARQGFEVFLPRIRHSKRRAAGWRLVAEPLFPRYLFVRVALGEQDTACIGGTRGVVGLVRFGGRPALMPEAGIQFLMARQDPALGAEAAAAPHRPGDRVAILSGPLAGLTGVFAMARDEERVAVLVELLGRRNRIEIARDALSEPLGAGPAPAVGIYSALALASVRG